MLTRGAPKRPGGYNNHFLVLQSLCGVAALLSSRRPCWQARPLSPSTPSRVRR